MEPQKSIVKVKTDIGDKVVSGFFGALVSMTTFTLSGALSYSFGMDQATFDSLSGVYIAGMTGSGILMSRYLYQGIFKNTVKEILQKEQGQTLLNSKFKAKRTFRNWETPVLSWDDGTGQPADKVNLITNLKGVYLEYVRVPKPLEKWDQSMNTVKSLYSIETKKKTLEMQS